MIQLVEHKVWWLDPVEKGRIREGVMTSRVLAVSEGNWFNLEEAGNDEIDTFMKECNKWVWFVTEAGTKSEFSIDEEYLKENAVFENPPEQFR